MVDFINVGYDDTKLWADATNMMNGVSYHIEGARDGSWCNNESDALIVKAFASLSLRLEDDGKLKDRVTIAY